MSVSGISLNNLMYDLFQSSSNQNNLLSNSQSTGFDISATDGLSDNNSNTIGADFNILLQALESGNLSTAQTSYSQLLQDIQAVSATDDTSASTSSTSGTGAASNPLARDMSDLGNAISSGDLTGAQSILANIMQHMQGHPPPPPDAGMFSGTDSVTSTNSTSNSSVLDSDLKALGEALSAGDLTSATDSFSQLLQDLQDAGSTDSSSSSTASTSDTSTTSSEYNRLLQSFLQILTNLTGMNTQTSTTSTVV
ncbi:MAG: hypothetical protein ABFD57_07405 [Smithella sp.]